MLAGSFDSVEAADDDFVLLYLGQIGVVDRSVGYLEVDFELVFQVVVHFAFAVQELAHYHDLFEPVLVLVDC